MRPVDVSLAGQNPVNALEVGLLNVLEKTKQISFVSQYMAGAGSLKSAATRLQHDDYENCT